MPKRPKSSQPIDRLTPRRVPWEEAGMSRPVLETPSDVKAYEKQLDEDLFPMMGRNASKHRKWLEGRGWKLVSNDLSYEWIWKKRRPARAGYAPFYYSTDEASTTALEKSSLEMFYHTQSAIRFAEKSEWFRAMRHAWLAGFNTGLSHARVIESRHGKRAGKGNAKKTTHPDRQVVFDILMRIRAKVGVSRFNKMTLGEIVKRNEWPKPSARERAPATRWYDKFGKHRASYLLHTFKKIVS